MQLEGRVALVTGAGSGIGKATAKLFAREGARVACLGRTPESVQETVREIESDDGAALPLIADISNHDAMRAAVEELDRQWGRLDIVFANAGINGTWAPIDDLEPDEWRQTVDVNLNGTYLTLHHTVPLLKREGGSIVITSSINGTRRFTGAGATAYAATKAAQVAMAQMLAVELSQHGIRVNVVCPGAIDTKIEEDMEVRNLEEAEVPVEYPAGKIPLTGGEPGSSEQVAELVLFLVSDQADFITGTPVWIDGGQALLQG
jgi:NAD(P)-dependent dehydrogenase (short-subunit alcohol dehydrogenase family)